LRDVLGCFIKRRICVSIAFTRRNPLDLARGHRLSGLSGAPPGTALPPLWWRDQPGSPSATSEIAIAMASMAVVLPLRLGGSRTPRPGPWSFGPPCRSRIGIPMGRSGLRGCPDLLLAIRGSGQEEQGSTRPSVRVQMAVRARPEQADPTPPARLRLWAPRGNEAAETAVGTGQETQAPVSGRPAASDSTSMVPHVASVQGPARLSLEAAGGLAWCRRSKARWNRHGPAVSDGLR
jgi:hypothetical protein